MLPLLTALLLQAAPPAAPPSVPASAAPPAARLAPEQLCTRVDAPVMIDVQADAPHTTLTLVLLTHDGALLGQANDVAEGRVDLAELFPLPELRRAAWLQLLVDGVAQGTPLIVQPLIGRPPIRTTESIRPDGTTRYTRIVGWGDDLIDPTNPDDESLRASWTPGEPTPWSGVRVYPDAVVVLATDHGDITVALRPDEAPNTAWNFRQIVESGLYGGTTFHRVVPVDRSGRPFVIQGGDPTGTGDGGPGYDLPIEPSRLRHDFGVISMARADDPDSAGSQFFFCLSREGTARLDGQYCAFGEAIDGAATILSIAEGSIADPATGRPDQPARILEARLVPALPHVPGLGRAEPRIERPKAAESEPLTPSGHAPR